VLGEPWGQVDCNLVSVFSIIPVQLPLSNVGLLINLSRLDNLHAAHTCNLFLVILSETYSLTVKISKFDG